MTTAETHSHSVPALPPDPRLIAMRRRVSTSGALAIVLADLAFGTRQRDHGEALNIATAARVASYMEARS